MSALVIIAGLVLLVLVPPIVTSWVLGPSRMFDVWEETRNAGPDTQHRVRLQMWGITITVWSWYE